MGAYGQTLRPYRKENRSEWPLMNRSGSQLALGIGILITAAVIVDAVFTGRKPWDIVLAVVRGESPPPKGSPGSGVVAPSTPTTGTLGKSVPVMGKAATGSITQMILWATLPMALGGPLGRPYQAGPGRFGPTYYDCSGFVKAAYRTIGIELTDVSQTQAKEGISIPIDPYYVRAGDLVIMDGSSPPNDHVGLAISPVEMVSAPHTGAVVRISAIPYGVTSGSAKITTIRRIIQS